MEKTEEIMAIEKDDLKYKEDFGCEFGKAQKDGPISKLRKYQQSKSKKIVKIISKKNWII